MEFLIESTPQFESSLAQLTDKEKESVINNINNCIKRFSKNKNTIYNQLQQINDLSLKQQGYFILTSQRINSLCDTLSPFKRT